MFIIKFYLNILDHQKIEQAWKSSKCKNNKDCTVFQIFKNKLTTTKKNYKSEKEHWDHSIVKIS